MIFFDYEKAFDKVNHYILMTKLLDLGIDGKILHWIYMFLTSRTMKVRIANRSSSSIHVSSGVPQGTCLGPILFLIYVNHVSSKVQSFFKVFADDTKFFLGFRVGPGQSASDALQADVDVMVETSVSWGLKLNIEKCAVMRFCSRGNPLPFSGISPYKINGQYMKFVTLQSDLGVGVDRELKFHCHISRTVGMIGGLMTNLLSSTLCRSEEFMRGLYTSHIRPKIEYASPLWNLGYIGDVKLLERLQRRWTRAVEGLELLSYGERLQKLDLFSLQGRFLRFDLILVWKIVHGISCIKFDDLFVFSPSTTTRGHQFKLLPSHCNLDVRRRSFAERVVNPWNSLSVQTVSSDNINTLKRLLQVDLGQSLFDYR